MPHCNLMTEQQKTAAKPKPQSMAKTLQRVLVFSVVCHNYVGHL